jgi:hypothetical protein
LLVVGVVGLVAGLVAARVDSALVLDCQLRLVRLTQLPLVVEETVALLVVMQKAQLALILYSAPLHLPVVEVAEVTT